MTKPKNVLEELANMDKPTKVRVRIAVAVYDGGTWDAGGSSVHDDEGNINLIINEGRWLGEPIHFIEADVPLPEIETIEGKVL